jgi:hypothetical protein
MVGRADVFAGLDAEIAVRHCRDWALTRQRLEERVSGGKTLTARWERSLPPEGTQKWQATSCTGTSGQKGERYIYMPDRNVVSSEKRTCVKVLGLSCREPIIWSMSSGSSWGMVC